MFQKYQWLAASILLISLLSGCSQRITVTLVHVLHGHTGEVLSLAFSPDGSLLVSGSADGTIKIWRVADGSEMRTIRGHQGPVPFVAFSADGKFVISSSDDRTIKGWQLADGSMAWAFTYTGDAKALWVTPERTILATSESLAGVAKLLNIPEGTEIRALKNPCWGGNSSVIPLTLSADGKWIAGYALGAQPFFASCIALWRFDDDYQKMLPFPSPGFFEFISSLAFSPNGRFLAAKLLYRIILLELEQGIIKDWPRILYVEERSPIMDSSYNVTFSPDGTLLAWCDSEGFVRMWQVPEGKEVKRFMAEGCPVSFSPDGQLLASGSVKRESSETTIKIWKLHRP